MAQDTTPYRHLNGDGVWPGFSWAGLELAADGSLALAPLPRLDGVPPAQLEALAAPQPAAGIAFDGEGTVFFSDPAHHVVWRIDGCTGRREHAACIGGEGVGATQLCEPSGLAISPQRHALYVADAGNGRVQIFDLPTMALTGMLDGLVRPVSIALDDESNLYVVDTQAHLADQYGIGGDRVAAFRARVQASGRVTDPRAVACEGGIVYLLDGQTGNICAFSGDGLIEEIETGVGGASVFTVIEGALYVGDPARRRIVAMRRDRTGHFARPGDAAGYEGPVAALAPDGAGHLLALPGGCNSPLALTLGGSHRADGWLWSAAITVDGVPHFWNRLHADIALPADSHAQFFVYAAAADAPPPAPSAGGQFAAPWRAVGDDVTDCFLSFDDAKHDALWIGARLTNDAHATPVLAQARVDFDQASYLPSLPAIYREKDWAAAVPGILRSDCGNFLLRYVSLFESFFDEVEGRIDELPALADPEAAPAAVLPWLSGFLALPLPEAIGEARLREAIASAYARYARRGTAAGLRDALRDEAGVHAVIDEPLQAAGWWSLPAPSASCRAPDAGTWTDGGDSILGVSTVLASAEPQGAVVGTTATLDRSQLIGQDAFGTPLFEALAYWFIVRLYPREVACAGKLDQVKAIIEREKPAHTLYEVCVIEPGLRVGYQATLGIDTLLDGPAVPARLGEARLVLGGESRGTLGVDSRVGLRTQL
jgi:phage tail-like protein